MQNIPQDLALGSTQQGVVPKPPVAPPKPADQRADTPPIPLVKVTSENTAPDSTPGSKPALPAQLAPPEPADQRSDTPPLPHVKVTSEDGAQESTLASTPPLPARMTRAKPAGQPDDGLLKPPARTLGPTPTGKKPNRLFGPKHLCPPDKTIEYKGGIHMQSWVKCPGERFWSHERSRRMREAADAKEAAAAAATGANNDTPPVREEPAPRRSIMGGLMGSLRGKKKAAVKDGEPAGTSTSLAQEQGPEVPPNRKDEAGAQGKDKGKASEKKAGRGFLGWSGRKE